MKNSKVEVVNFEMDEEGKADASGPSVFKFLWDAKMPKNPISGAKVNSGKLYKEFEHICRSEY